MLDDLQSDGLGDGRKRERPGNSERPLADREVPLGPPTSSIADAVHTAISLKINARAILEDFS